LDETEGKRIEQVAITEPVRKFNPSISWIHYIQLMRIKNIDERRFYEIEIEENGWTIKEFQRQFN
jgi:hypothetical protein